MPSKVANAVDIIIQGKGLSILDIPSTCMAMCGDSLTDIYFRLQDIPISELLHTIFTFKEVNNTRRKALDTDNVLSSYEGDVTNDDVWELDEQIEYE